MSHSPFDIMGMPPRFDLDEAALQKQFVALSAKHHPDRFSDPLDQADAAEQSSRINQAYHTLRDPESRANALLEYLGGPSKSDDKSLPADLLMEMMELREAHEQAVADNDQATIQQLARHAREQRETRLARITELFAQNPPALVEIRLELNALRYFQRMIEQI